MIGLALPSTTAAKQIIEPQRKPDTNVGGVEVPALTTKDQTSPIPPGQEPGGSGKGKKPAAKAEGRGDEAEAESPTVSSSQAKQLVSQLAALSSDKPEAPAKAPAASKAQSGDDEGEGAKAAPAASTPAAEGGDAEEPLNRGLLLKFLSSVRQ